MKSDKVDFGWPRRNREAITQRIVVSTKTVVRRDVSLDARALNVIALCRAPLERLEIINTVLDSKGSQRNKEVEYYKDGFISVTV